MIKYLFYLSIEGEEALSQGLWVTNVEHCGALEWEISALIDLFLNFLSPHGDLPSDLIICFNYLLGQIFFCESFESSLRPLSVRSNMVNYFL